MAYKTHEYTDGDTIYATDMNNIIAGIDQINEKLGLSSDTDLDTSTELFSLMSGLTRADKISNGITYTWNGDVCTVSGTVDGTQSFNNMIVMEPIDTPLEPGKTYHLEVNSTDENIYVKVFQTIDGVSSSVNIKKSADFTLNSAATRTVIRLQVDSGNTVNGTISPKLYVAKSNSTTETTGSGKRSIKILHVGNSFTLNCVPYVPHILKNLAESEIDLTIGTTYYSGCTIDKYITFLSNDSAELRYNKNVGLSNNWTQRNNLTLKQILADEDWDVITFQQGSTSQENWSTYSNLNTLINNVLNYKLSVHPKSIKFGWLMPQLRLTIKTDESYNNMITCVKNLLAETPIEFVIPCGTAIENARLTSLNSLGSYESGGLTNDGAHLHKGVPTLLVSYVSALSILKLIGIESHGVLGEQTRPTDDWLASNVTISSNGTYSVGVTEENCIIAQKCAIAAIKNPFVISTIVE